MASASKSIRGFAVVCPFCGEAGATVTIELNDPRACTCLGCDAEFSPQSAVAKLAGQVRRWEAVVRWTELAGEMIEPE